MNLIWNEIKRRVNNGVYTSREDFISDISKVISVNPFRYILFATDRTRWIDGDVIIFDDIVVFRLRKSTII